MSPRSKRPDDDLLDLPFGSPPESGSSSDLEPEGREPEVDEPTNLPLFEGESDEGDEDLPVIEDPVAQAASGAADAPQVDAEGRVEDRVTPAARWLSGSVDVLIHAGVLAAVLLVLFLGFGVEPRRSDWLGYLLFLLSFSFLYVTLPLAFWGQTPGMAWLRLQTRDHDDRPMTFGQTVVQWLVGLGTVVLGGVPLFLMPGERSLSDRLTGSVTHRFPAAD